jgi:Ca2+-binding RTX toxin-like protein
MTVTSTYSRLPVKPEFTANTFTTGDQLASDVLHLSSGGFVVAYNNHDVANGFVLLDLYRPDHQHIVQRQAYGGAANDSSAIGEPSLTELSNGNVLVVWDDNNPASLGAKATIFTPTGVYLMLEKTLVAGSVSQIDVAALDDGFVVSYGSASDVYVCRFDAHGAQQGPPVAVDTGSSGLQESSQVTALLYGGFVVTWKTSSGINNQDIHARVFNEDGSARSGAFVVDATGSNTAPAIAALQNGNWAVVYSDNSWVSEGGGSGISLQIRDWYGNSVLPALHVNTPTPLQDVAPDVAVLSNGFILVTWAKEMAAGNFDVYGRLFTATGQPVALQGSTAEFLVSSTSGQDQNPAVAALLGGSFITTWDSSDNNSADIAARIDQFVRGTAGDGADDIFAGDALRDIIDGGDGDDVLLGRAGDDMVAGGNGDDWLWGEYGDDILSGGSGNDVFVFHDRGGKDTVTDFASDFLSHDKIDLSAFEGLTLSQVLAEATQVGLDTVFNFGNGDTLTLLNVQKASLGAAAFGGLLISGDDGDNTLPGTSFGETIQGLGGNDVLTGGLGNDVLDGGTGDDTAVFSQSLDKYLLKDYGTWIEVRGPDGIDTLTGIEHLQFSDGTLNPSDGSALFDTVYYMRNNLDVFHAGVNALDHYNAIGWHEGRDPNALFDTSGYLAVNKDVAAAGVNPLDHYHNSGWHEGRDPSAWFDTTLYLLRNPDVAAAGVDPLAHYLANGRAEGRDAHAAVGQVAGGFDAQYYLFRNPDVAAAGIDPLFHFNAIGWQEGRDPNAFFDTADYLAQYTDVAAAGINPLWHYETIGWTEGRDPSEMFDTAGYLAAYPDVAAAGMNPLDHFLQFGIYEGRWISDVGI